jgi:2-polyprenyl-6-methoxyphenol hydroxylase-like FAD-dependent oxidoreductase
VVGAGPAGLTAALALRCGGWEVEVVERARSLEAKGAGLTLWPNAMTALDLVGAGDAARRASVACDGIELRSASGRVLDATPRHVMEERWGGTGYAFHRAELVETLLRLVGPERVRLGVACDGFHDEGDGVTVSLSDGGAVAGDVLVGADGIHSLVRERLLGPVPLRYSGFAVWRALAAFELEQHVGVTTLGRGAQFGLFPVRDGRAYWFACAPAPEGARIHGPHKPALPERFAGWHEPIGALLEATPEEEIVVSGVHDFDPLRTWSAGRVVLIGDAAHASVPHLGQGACQAIEDAVVLGGCLASEPTIALALGQLERRRVARAASLSKQARRLADLGRLDWRLVCAFRDAMISRTPERSRLRHLARLFEWDTSGLADAFTARSTVPDEIREPADGRDEEVAAAGDRRPVHGQVERAAH